MERYFYLSSFFREYFYLSTFLGGYFYFYLVTFLEYLLQHWVFVDVVFKTRHSPGTITHLGPMVVSCNTSYFPKYIHRPHFASLSMRMFV